MSSPAAQTCTFCDRPVTPGVEHECDKVVSDPKQKNVVCRNCGRVLGAHLNSGGLHGASLIVLSFAQIQCPHCKHRQKFRPSPA